MNTVKQKGLVVDRLGDYLLGPNDTPENGIYTGDCRDLAEAIPDESVDLIFTDPVYDQFGDYRWLAETAVRVLKPDSACLIWNGIGYLPEIMKALDFGGLQYKWQMPAFVPSGVKSRVAMKNVFSNWRSVLWFEKGSSSPKGFMSDVCYSYENVYRGLVGWGKSVVATRSWLAKFTNAADIVIDPFVGGGTVPAVCKMLGRRWLAFEIEPDTAEMARKRVRETQPPLFVPQMEQAALFE